MAPFFEPCSVVTGLKERADSLTVQGDRLYVGTSTGTVLVYKVDQEHGALAQPAELLDTRKGLSRRAIEQLECIPDITSLAVLSDSLITLYPLPSFSPATPLPKTKSAFSFTVSTFVKHDSNDQSTDLKGAKLKGVPCVVTSLAVGCRRKLIVYSWRDGEPQDTLELPLPHSPRSMAFLDEQSLCLGYTPTDYVLYSLATRSSTEVVTPVNGPTSSTSIGGMGMGMGALSGLGGYIGLGAKAKPSCFKVNDQEGFIAKENTGVFIGMDGKTSRPSSVDWPASPEDVAFVKPYIVSILPSGSVPASSAPSLPNQASYISTAVLEIRSAISLTVSQALPAPFGSESVSPAHSARLLTPSPTFKSPLFLVTTPSDRTAAAAEGSTIWQFTMKSWEEQVDELVREGAYSDALTLLANIDEAVLPNKDARQRVVRALHTVSRFRAAQYSEAINEFLELNTNPAKVVALYPESVSGRLSVPEDEWIQLFGGPAHISPSSSIISEEVPTAETDPDTPEAPVPRPPSPQGSVRNMLRTGLDSIRPTPKKEEELETATMKAKRKEFQFRKSLEELMRYLSDRRPKVAGALEALNITTAQSHQLPFLSAASKEDLFALPDVPLTALTPEELVRFAQIVDTALFKCYLLVRPGLLAPLCRVSNWCEVSEVEEVLREREKFSELIYLYNGKKMHNKALTLLQQLSEKETDMRDKLMPLVNYLQRLGPEHINLIFEYARWVFDKDRDIAFEIFTSEEAELPRHVVADFLEKIDPAVCARFVEYLISEKGDETVLFHNRLAELYLKMAVTAKRTGDNETRQTMRIKLLEFVETTAHYETDRLFGLLPSDDLFEVKAVLLGKMGRHDNALEIYVYRLQDFIKAEEYCKSVFQPGTETKNIFFTLLRIYLRPTVRTNIDLLTPALDLISRHSPRLDKVETLQILPPLVTAQSVRAFLMEALRAPVFHTRVSKEVSKARDEQLARKLMHLQARRVKITDTRICPQCHKRIGHSVIAVHSPRGEVTHYQCRELFSQKLKELHS